MSKEDFERELKDAVKFGYIKPYESIEALKKFNKTGDQSILEIIASRKSGKELLRKDWSELTEAESLKMIVYQNRKIISISHSTNQWVKFFGIVLIVELVIGVAIALTML